MEKLSGIFPLVLLLALTAPLAAAEDWKEYQAGEAGFQAPADWRIDYRQKDSGYRLKSPDGDYALLAQWWFVDATPKEGETIVSRRDVLADGQPATLIHSRLPGRQILKLILDKARADHKQFIVVLESDRHDFGGGSNLHREIVSRLRFGPRPMQQPTPPPVAEQEDIPGLSSHLGKDCRAVDPAVWKHPTLAVIEQRQAIHLQWIKLCDGDTTPVFGARFDFDPQGQTKDFFLPLYLDTLDANSGRAVAFVSLQDNLLIRVRQEGKDSLNLNYIELDQPPPDPIPAGAAKEQ